MGKYLMSCASCLIIYSFIIFSKKANIIWAQDIFFVTPAQLALDISPLKFALLMRLELVPQFANTWYNYLSPYPTKPTLTFLWWDLLYNLTWPSLTLPSLAKLDLFGPFVFAIRCFRFGPMTKDQVKNLTDCRNDSQFRLFKVFEENCFQQSIKLGFDS